MNDMTDTSPRTGAGVSAGGQFANKNHADSDVELPIPSAKEAAHNRALLIARTIAETADFRDEPNPETDMYELVMEDYDMLAEFIVQGIEEERILSAPRFDPEGDFFSRGYKRLAAAKKPLKLTIEAVQNKGGQITYVGTDVTEDQARRILEILSEESRTGGSAS